MAKKWVRLKDSGSIFHDTSTNETLTGKLTIEMTESPRLTRAISGGVLILSSESEAAHYNSQFAAEIADKTANDEATKQVNEAAEAAALEAKAKFDGAISAGDSAMAEKDYQGAVDAYNEALSIDAKSNKAKQSLVNATKALNQKKKK